MTDRFDDYYDAMTAAVQRFVQHSTTLELIEVTTREQVERKRGNDTPVGGTVIPFDWELGRALHDNHAYRLASSRRDSARRAAVMWAVVAQVEAQARGAEATR